MKIVFWKFFEVTTYGLSRIDMQERSQRRMLWGGGGMGANIEWQSNEPPRVVRRLAPPGKFWISRARKLNFSPSGTNL